MLSDRLVQLFQLGGTASDELRAGDPALADRIEALYRARDGRHPRLLELVRRVRLAEAAAAGALTTAAEVLAIVNAELQSYSARHRPPG